MNAAVATIHQECRDEIPRIVREHRESAKVIAFKIGKTPRAVENIGQGNNIPSLPTAIMLARHIPQLKAKLLEWIEADHNLDPELDRKTIRLALAIQDHLGKS